MSNHVIKYEYDDGVKLSKPEVWCGRTVSRNTWMFTGAQHVALAAGGGVQPCKNCIKAIIKQLEIEL